MLKLYDIHTHTWIQKSNLYNESVFPRRLNLEKLVNSYKWKINKIITFPMPWSDFFDWNFSKSKNPYSSENKELVINIENLKLNNVVLPFVCIHPKIMVSEQLEVIYNLMKNNKIYWIKFHTLDTSSYIKDFFYNTELVSFCIQNNLPILIHSANFDWYENCNNIFEFAKKYKDLNICIAHMMWFSYDFFDKLNLYENNNLYFDCSPFLWMCKFALHEIKEKSLIDLPFNKAKEALKNLFLKFPDRLIWWSDQPFWNFSIDNEYIDFWIIDELDLLFSLEKDIILKIANENSEKFLKLI